MAINKNNIIYSFKHRPPLTITVIGAILLFLMSSKEQLIDSMPISNSAYREILGSWYMYVLKVAGVIFAILQIVLGVNKDGEKPDTDYPTKP